MKKISYKIKRVLRGSLPTPILRFKRGLQRRLSVRKRKIMAYYVIKKYGCFGPDYLYSCLKQIGIKNGGVLLVQSAFDRLYNFAGTPVDIIEVLERLVGTEGTLLMPSHTSYKDSGPFVFDSRKSPAHTGIICEMFRRLPDVVRSLHPTHSVCAKGPLARILTEDHHKEPLSCGVLSPYAKLMKYGGDILGLGLPPGYTTFLHVIEDIDLKDYPRRTYLDEEFDFLVIDSHGKETKLKIRRRDPEQGCSLDLNRVVTYLTTPALKTFSIAGVPSFLAKSEYLYHEMQRLKKQGIILYA